MPRPLHEKSTVEEIRARFDAVVERFSQARNGPTGRDGAPIILDVIARSAACHVRPTRHASRHWLRRGKLYAASAESGFSLGLRSRRSQPTHARLCQRTGYRRDHLAESRQSNLIWATLPFTSAIFDIILAGQVLHHLREDAEWEAMFASFYRWLRPAGSLFIADLVAYDDPAIQSLMQGRYAEHLEKIGGPEIATKFWLMSTRKIHRAR